MVPFTAKVNGWGFYLCLYNKYNIACIATWRYKIYSALSTANTQSNTKSFFLVIYIKGISHVFGTTILRWKVQLNIHNNQIASSYLELINQLENQLITIKFNHCIFSDLAFGLENQGSIWWWRHYQWEIKLQ